MQGLGGLMTDLADESVHPIVTFMVLLKLTQISRPLMLIKIEWKYHNVTLK